MQRLATTCLDEAHMKHVDFARPKWRGVILQCYMGTALETRNPLAMQDDAGNEGKGSIRM